MKGNGVKYRVLRSLHRPYHRPLWIVKWVCYFWCLRSRSKYGRINYDDVIVDFYFSLIEWLFYNYPKDSDGIPSFEAITNVFYHFSNIASDKKDVILKGILAKKKREKGIETQVYSTYKAAGYYLNLADEKLHFVDEQNNPLFWDSLQLKKTILKSDISHSDRRIYLKQLLRYDGHFFIAMCILHGYVAKTDLKLEELVFSFVQRYYPVDSFNYTRQSLKNYFDVRTHWMELLRIISDNGVVSRILKITASEDEESRSIYNDVKLKAKDFLPVIKRKERISEQKKHFISIYIRLSSNNENKSGFVNLYDICDEMKMNYNRFESFLTLFYQEEKMSRNIFFINIVSTIDQRKRFYIGNTPVMKIKITQNNGI